MYFTVKGYVVAQITALQTVILMELLHEAHLLYHHLDIVNRQD